MDLTLRCEATNLGVFDLCHFDLLKRGCAKVVPYCAIPRDYLSDTPLLRAMGGFRCLNMANWVRYLLPLF